MPDKMNEHDLLRQVLEATEEYERIDALCQEAKQKKQKAEEDLIKYLKDNDLKGFQSIPLNTEVTHRDTLYVSIEEGKEGEAFAFIDEELGRSDVIRKTIHHKTLTSLISERIKNGEPFPENTFKRFWKPYLKLAKINK